jgi:hypothetical protein
MAKITKLEQQFKDNKPNGFKINLDNGVFGYLVEKDSDRGIKEGDEVFYTEETPTGKNYKKITVHLTQGGLTPSGTSQSPAPQPQPGKPIIHVGGKSKEEIKCECAIRILEAILDGFFDAKIESTQVSIKAIEYTKLLWSEVDEAFAGK